MKHRPIQLIIALQIFFVFKIGALPPQSVNLGNCDQIILVKGKAIEAKVLEVNQLEIVYRKCDNTKGPIYLLDIYKVEKIKYSNGTEHKIDYLDKEQEEKTATFFWKVIGSIVVLLMALIGVLAFFGLGK